MVIRIRVPLLILAFTVFVAAEGRPQGRAAGSEGISTLYGGVRDLAGHVIVGAVLLVEVDDPAQPTGRRWRTTSTTLGDYEITGLPIGRYRVTITAPPFESLVKVVVLQQPVEGLNITLELPRHAEKISVPSKAVLPSSAMSPSIGTLFTRARIEALPLVHGPTVQSLLHFVPGVVPTEPLGVRGQFSAVGQRLLSHWLTIDGVSANLGLESVGGGVGAFGSGTLFGYDLAGSTRTQIPLHAIRELRVLMTGATAEDRRSPGAQLAIVTRSGSDRFTASADASMRPDALRSSDPFPTIDPTINLVNLVPQTTQYGDTTAAIGGPLWPTRVWFFATGDVQWIKHTFSTTISVPSARLRETAPLHLQPLLRAFPLPNGPAGEEEGLAEFSAPRPDDLSSSSVNVRLDATLLRDARMFARISRGQSERDSGRQSFSSSQSTSLTSTTLGVRTAGASITHDLTADVSEHLQQGSFGPGLAGTAGPFLFEDLLPAGRTEANSLVQVRVFPGLGGSLAAGRAPTQMRRQWQVAYALGMTQKHHTWRVGADYREVMEATIPAPYRYQFTFSGLTNFLQGRTVAIVAEESAPTRMRFPTASFFAQDTYRPLPRLTIDAGVRGTIRPAPVSRTDLEPLLLRFETLPALETRPVGSSLWATQRNFAPRIGAAYLLNASGHHETTLHGAWGLVFDDVATGTSLIGATYPYMRLRVLRGSAVPANPNDLQVPLPAPFSAEDFAGYRAFPSRLRSPKAYEGQIGVEHTWGTQRLNLTYVRAAGRDLVYAHTHYLRPSGHTTTIAAVSNDGRSDYQGLLTEYRRLFSRGFGIDVVYTFSRARDNDTGRFQPPPHVLQPSSNRGPADYDYPHVLHMNVSLDLEALRWPATLRPLVAATQLQIVGAVQSGAPVTVTTDRELDGVFGFYSLRPDAVSGQPIWIPAPTVPGGRRVNPAAYQIPVERRQGTLARNTLRGAPLRQVDISLSRTFTLGARRTLQIRADAYNVFNLLNIGPPYGGLANSTRFGRPLGLYATTREDNQGLSEGGGLIPVLQSGGARTIQLGVRFGM